MSKTRLGNAYLLLSLKPEESLNSQSKEWKITYSLSLQFLDKPPEPDHPLGLSYQLPEGDPFNAIAQHLQQRVGYVVDGLKDYGQPLHSILVNCALQGWQNGAFESKELGKIISRFLSTDGGWGEEDQPPLVEGGFTSNELQLIMQEVYQMAQDLRHQNPDLILTMFRSHPVLINGVRPLNGVSSS